MTGRIDLFTFPHKALRRELFLLASEAARTDPSILDKGHPLPARAAAVLDRLEKHAGHEDRFIEPLLREVAPALAGAMAREHRASAPDVAALRAQALRLAEEDIGARSAALRTFIGDLNRFIGAYLLHLDHEERTIMPAIWAACDEARLMDVMRAFNTERGAEEIRDDALAMLPALNSAERQMLLAGTEALLSAKGDPSLFADVVAAAQAVAVDLN